MSERYSFSTEYIYCENCAAEFRKQALFVMDMSQPNRGFAAHKTSHIIAGFGGGLARWEPQEEMTKLRDALAEKLCHPLRFAAFYDNGETEFFFVRPRA